MHGGRGVEGKTFVCRSRSVATSALKGGILRMTQIKHKQRKTKTPREIQALRPTGNEWNKEKETVGCC